jgi:hypothetical protein
MLHFQQGPAQVDVTLRASLSSVHWSSVRNAFGFVTNPKVVTSRALNSNSCLPSWTS